MALKMYKDEACTEELLSTERFTGDGATTAFALTRFSGAQLGSVYLETQTVTAGVTFANGVGSGFSGLTPSALIGQRLIHNGCFRGTVTANDATTVTISDLTYSEATAGNATVCQYLKKTAVTDYTVAGNTVTTLFTASASQSVHCVPASTLTMNFGGTAGTEKTTQSNIWLNRTAGYTYDTLQVTSEDQSVPYASLTQTGISFAAGVGSGFAGLTPGALKGRALNHAGVFRGVVTANTDTTVTISDVTYDGDASDAVCYTIGSLLFAPDSGGAPGAWARAVHPAPIDNDTPVKIWVKDTVTVPTAAMNYPNIINKATGIEYLV